MRVEFITKFATILAILLSLFQQTEGNLSSSSQEVGKDDLVGDADAIAVDNPGNEATKRKGRKKGKKRKKRERTEQATVVTVINEEGSTALHDKHVVSNIIMEETKLAKKSKKRRRKKGDEQHGNYAEEIFINDDVETASNDDVAEDKRNPVVEANPIHLAHDDSASNHPVNEDSAPQPPLASSHLGDLDGESDLHSLELGGGEPTTVPDEPSLADNLIQNETKSSVSVDDLVDEAPEKEGFVQFNATSVTSDYGSVELVQEDDVVFESQKDAPTKGQEVFFNATSSNDTAAMIKEERETVTEQIAEMHSLGSNESDFNIATQDTSGESEIKAEADPTSVSSPIKIVLNETKEHCNKSHHLMTSTVKSGVDEVMEAPNDDVRLSPSNFVELDTKNIALSEDKESDFLVSVATWNLAEILTDEESASFIRKFRKFRREDRKSSKGRGSDIVCISAQECENIKPRRSEGHRSRELRRLMIKMLGKNYVPLAIHSLGGIQFGLFCKSSFLSQIESCSIADVTCGIGNVFHNKGAIGAFVQLKGVRKNEKSIRAKATPLNILFIGAHQAAHVKNVEARNNDFSRIMTELEAQAPPEFFQKRTPSRTDNDGHATEFLDSVDRIFFCGDLNYRLDLPRELAENHIEKMRELEGTESRKGEKKRLRNELLRHDQLKQVIAAGDAFPGFAEGDIAFAPTFKFDKGTKDYDSSHKQRIPAWTDRVLYKPFGVRVLKYECEHNTMLSDHRPVHATFRVSRTAWSKKQR